ncbi:hypothetical protein NDA01_29885 [Trichocoleus desertorum AS-A10]|uniref:hypothetical protein n=1 Tax=Trichocoleus desertorum TaxID=1481672 RepID=UPI003299C7D4
MAEDSEAQSARTQRKRELRLQIWGWFLFIASASFYTVSSLRSGDILSLLGSLFFLAACLISATPVISQQLKSTRKN